MNKKLARRICVFVILVFILVFYAYIFSFPQNQVVKEDTSFKERIYFDKLYFGGVNETNTTAFCGDGIINSDELCDGNDQRCVINGYDGLQSCSLTCDSFNDCITSELCGDNVVNGNEECDDGNANSSDGCSSTCETEPGPICGNGIVEEGEECDGGNLNNMTCADVGWSGGNLTCIMDEKELHRCVFDESGCFIHINDNNDGNKKASHLECVNEMCVSVFGEGENKCSINSECYSNDKRRSRELFHH